MSKNKIAPKGLPKYVVTTSDGGHSYFWSQSSAKDDARFSLEKGYRKVQMFKVSYDFYETFSAKK